jgi:hypothetical protein
LTTGLPDFSWPNLPKRRKMYQMTIKFTKCPQNIPNYRKIYQMTIKYTYIFHCKTVQNLPKLGFLFENKPSRNPDWQASIKCSLVTFRQKASDAKLANENISKHYNQGCQMVYFQTKKSQFG